jgi:hypothetical protein
MAVFSRECRERYLRGELKKAKKLFKITRNLYIEQRQAGKNDEELEDIIKNGINLSKKIKGYEISIGILEGKISKKNIITDEMIERAREYPIVNLVEVGVNGRAKCIWHDSTDYNMDIRKNFAHCYVCNSSGGVIDVYMELHNCGFKEAVIALQ